jgi:hypothetical protein
MVFDWSNFSSVSGIKSLYSVFLDFFTTTVLPYSLASGRANNPAYGLFRITLQQNMMITETDVKLMSLDNSLALIGGYAGTVWLLIACACGGFAQFAYQNSLVREFIKKRRQNDQVAVGDEESSNDIEQVINSTEPVVFSYA